MIFDIEAIDKLCIPTVGELAKLQLTQFEREQRWLEKRVGKFTSSILPKLMTKGRKGQEWGDTSITEMLTVADELISGERRISVKGVRALDFGNQYEAEAHLYYNKTYNINSKSGSTGFDEILFVEPFEGFGDSPDADVNPDGTVEIKCPENGVNHLKYTIIRAIHDRSDYYWQILGHLLDPKKEWCDFVTYNPRYSNGHSLKIHRVRVWKKDHLFNLELLQNRIETALTYVHLAVEENDMNIIYNINNHENE